VRHRTASLNEYSARYSVLDSEFYIPDADKLAAQSTANRQGRDEVLSVAAGEKVRDLLRSDAEQAFAHYHDMLNEGTGGQPADAGRQGLARELARIGLPVSTYTQWYWKVNLHNLLHFLGLRADAHAQWEIRAYANVILDIVKRWAPLTHAAFMNYQVGGARLTPEGLAIVRKLIKSETVDESAIQMSPREWRELQAILGLS
jgi:thymidylate synthase (FAD)